MWNNNYFTFRLFRFLELSSSLPPLSLNPYSFSYSFADQEAIISLTRDPITVFLALKVVPLFDDTSSLVGRAFHSHLDSLTGINQSPIALRGTYRASTNKMLIY